MYGCVVQGPTGMARRGQPKGQNRAHDGKQVQQPSRCQTAVGPSVQMQPAGALQVRYPLLTRDLSCRGSCVPPIWAFFMQWGGAATDRGRVCVQERFAVARGDFCLGSFGAAVRSDMSDQTWNTQETPMPHPVDAAQPQGIPLRIAFGQIGACSDRETRRSVGGSTHRYAD